MEILGSILSVIMLVGILYMIGKAIYNGPQCNPTWQGIQLVSVTHDFKFLAPDGKRRAADALDNECVQILAKHYPNNRANAFLDWFTYSDNSIDGQSKKTDHHKTRYRL